MTSICPAGHTSEAADYCDVCGAPIAQTTAPGAPPPSTDPPADASLPNGGAPTSAAPALDGDSQACPNCGTPNAIDALFCENCGYDFTTGTMPRPLTPPAPDPALAPDADAPDATAVAPVLDAGDATAAAAAEFVAEVWIDPAWYAAQQSTDPMPSPGPPEVVPLRATSLLVGRTSQSRNIHPEIDCDTDSGVSRRQAQLTSDGHRWWVEDLESANGTFVAPASSPLPEDPISVGVKRELAPDDRIYVGAWTRIVIRPATEDEGTTQP